VTNIRNGGNNPIAGFAHAVTLILLIFFLATLASDITGLQTLLKVIERVAQMQRHREVV
jgi:hypothetical protein